MIPISRTNRGEYLPPVERPPTAEASSACQTCIMSVVINFKGTVASACIRTLAQQGNLPWVVPSI